MGSACTTVYVVTPEDFAHNPVMSRHRIGPLKPPPPALQTEVRPQLADELVYSVKHYTNSKEINPLSSPSPGLISQLGNLASAHSNQISSFASNHVLPAIRPIASRVM